MKNNKGFTLLELMISGVILIIFIMIVFSFVGAFFIGPKDSNESIDIRDQNVPVITEQVEKPTIQGDEKKL